MNIDEISIHIHPGADGKKFWSEIVQATPGKPVTLWEQVETSDTRQEAFDRAENALDKMIDAENEALAAAETQELPSQEMKQQDVGIGNKSFLY